MVQGEFGDQLIVAHHHEDDVFEIPWVLERAELYIAGCIPHVRIDGKYAIRGAQNCSSAAAEYREAINRRLAETGGSSSVAVAGAYFVDTDSVRAAATFTLQDADTLQDTRGFLLMLVSDLYWHYVWYDHVTQGAYEEDISLVHPGDQVILQAAFPRDPSWQAEDIDCLAFVQCMSDSFEVYQSAWLLESSGHADSRARASAPGLRLVGPNPFCPRQAAASICLAASGPAPAGPGPAVQVLDSSGRRVTLLRPTELRPADGRGDGWVYRWDGRDAAGRHVPVGAYWLRALGGGRTGRARLVVIR